MSQKQYPFYYKIRDMLFKDILLFFFSLQREVAGKSEFKDNWTFNKLNGTK